MTKICPECGEEFHKIGYHWSMGDCSYPSFSDYQKEVLTGLLMGDGCVNRSGNNPCVECNMISPDYLSYIDECFGVLGCGVSKGSTAQERAERDRSSGFNLNAKAENYSDIYRWNSVRHPEIKFFADWYLSGEKVWPSDIELTPPTLRHFYCGDGTWQNGSSHNRITIGMSNEVENTEKVSKIFRRSGLPEPSNYNIGEKKCEAQFTVSQTQELFEYMEHSLPDFDYKFPDEYC